MADSSEIDSDIELSELKSRLDKLNDSPTASASSPKDSKCGFKTLYTKV